MRNILENIIKNKTEEVLYKRKMFPLDTGKYPNMERTTISLKNTLLKNDYGIIAEFKRKSPSKGNINKVANIEKTTAGYIKSGASAISVLTDELFFGGTNQDLVTARIYNDCPILRKDFIIDEFQIYETKSIGADAILLIASVLSPYKVKRFAMIAKQIGLEVLLEIHTKSELDRINEYIDIVGVNNRNLEDFTVSIENSLELFDFIPNEFLKISESGIDTVEKLLKLKEKGFNGFLIGEQFMSTENPEISCADFIAEIRKTQTIRINEN